MRSFDEIYHSLLEASEGCYQRITSNNSSYFEVWDDVLNRYEGGNIIEVICREAFVITIKNSCNYLNRFDLGEFEKEFIFNIREASKKYKLSEDWDESEIRRIDDLEKKLKLRRN